MWLDAALAYLHYAAVFMLFAFLTTQLYLVRLPLVECLVRLIGRVDLWYGASAGFVLLTGFLRAGLGAKGGDFYFGAWPIYAKIALFAIVGFISLKPTLTYQRWRRAYDGDKGWTVPADEQARMRRIVMIELHLAALIPLVAVIMARGLGR
jgi:putative membrane protein